jgi:hypothetical protein
MKILLLLLLQFGALNDLMDLRKFLGTDFAGAMKLLEPTNTKFIQNLPLSSSAQAARLRAEMAVPASLGATQNVVPLVVTNVGRGLVTTLFEDDFITEQVNLVFCPAAPRRVVAVQVLFDDRSAIRDTLFLLQRIYQMPKPSVFETYKPEMKYDLAGVTYAEDLKWTRAATAPAVTVFDLGETAEVIYQPVTGQKLVTGQLWVGDKKAAETCTVPIVTQLAQ